MELLKVYHAAGDVSARLARCGRAGVVRHGTVGLRRPGRRPAHGGGVRGAAGGADEPVLSAQPALPGPVRRDIEYAARAADAGAEPHRHRAGVFAGQFGAERTADEGHPGPELRPAAGAFGRDGAAGQRESGAF